MIHVITSGYFNPIMNHHIHYIDSSYELGKSLAYPLEHVKLTIIVNNDCQVRLKGSCPFHPYWERVCLVRKMYPKADVIGSGSTTKDISSDLRGIMHKHEDNYPTWTIFRPRKVIFCNGGDRIITNADHEEIATCANYGIQMYFGIGGSEKGGSSSGTIEQAARWWIKNKMKESEN